MVLGLEEEILWFVLLWFMLLCCVVGLCGFVVCVGAWLSYECK